MSVCFNIPCGNRWYYQIMLCVVVYIFHSTAAYSAVLYVKLLPISVICISSVLVHVTIDGICQLALNVYIYIPQYNLYVCLLQHVLYICGFHMITADIWQLYCMSVCSIWKQLIYVSCIACLCVIYDNSWYMAAVLYVWVFHMITADIYQLYCISVCSIW